MKDEKFKDLIVLFKKNIKRSDNV